MAIFRSPRLICILSIKSVSGLSTLFQTNFYLPIKKTVVFKNRHNRKLLYVHYRCGGSIGITPISHEIKIHLTNFDGILATLGLFVDFSKNKKFQHP